MFKRQGILRRSALKLDFVAVEIVHDFVGVYFECVIIKHSV